MNVLDVARLWKHVRETSQNQGQRVNAIQMFSGGASALGTSWCCWFVTLILDLFFAGVSPIRRMGSCEELYQLAKDRGWLTDAPQSGDLFLRLHADTGLAHHVGFYIGPRDDGDIDTLSGNTDALGVSSNGDRVAEHPIAPTPGTVAYVAYPRS